MGPNKQPVDVEAAPPASKTPKPAEEEAAFLKRVGRDAKGEGRQDGPIVDVEAFAAVEVPRVLTLLTQALATPCTRGGINLRTALHEIFPIDIMSAGEHGSSFKERWSH